MVSTLVTPMVPAAAVAASLTVTPSSSVVVKFRVSSPVPPSMVSVPVTAPPTVKVSAAEPPVRSRLAPAFRPADTSKVVAPVLPTNFSMPDTVTAVPSILVSLPSAAKVMAAAVPVSCRVSAVPVPPSMVSISAAVTAPTWKVSAASPAPVAETLRASPTAPSTKVMPVAPALVTDTPSVALLTPLTSTVSKPW